MFKSCHFSLNMSGKMAMEDEFIFLLENNTWKIVELGEPIVKGTKVYANFWKMFQPHNFERKLYEFQTLKCNLFGAQYFCIVRKSNSEVKSTCPTYN